MFTVGIDFGTNSVRALVVRCADGAEFGSSVVNYPSGRQGVLLEESDVSTILDRTTGVVRLRAHPEATARSVVDGLGWAKRRDGAPPGFLLVDSPPERLAELNRQLVGAGVEVSELAPERMSLEEYFLAAGKPDPGAKA